MDSAHLVDRALGVFCGAEGRDGEEGAGALQSAPRVAPVIGVVGDAGHGERVQRLKEQRPQTADVHGGVGVYAPDGTVLCEPPRPGSVVDAGPVHGAVRSRDQSEQGPTQAGTHSAEFVAQGHAFDGTVRLRRAWMTVWLPTTSRQLI